MPEFIDLFSDHAALYAKARPHYPPELFDYLAGLCAARSLAWDVGAGNGQAAVGLAAHFERVIATDASAEQLKHAAPHPRVTYHISTAENAALVATPNVSDVSAPNATATDGTIQPATGGLIQPASVDLVTIAQALHWLVHDAFYANARRALRPGGVIAAWCYTLPRVEPRIDAVLDAFYHGVTGPYWEPQRRYIDERFETIPFPFDEIRVAMQAADDSRVAHPSRARHGSVDAYPSRAPPPLTMQSIVMDEQAGDTGPSRDHEAAGSTFACRSEWTLEEYLAYIESWSAVQKYRRERGSDPLDLIRDDLLRAWGEPELKRPALSPIYLRVGRNR